MGLGTLWDLSLVRLHSELRHAPWRCALHRWTASVQSHWPGRHLQDGGRERQSSPDTQWRAGKLEINCSMSLAC